MVKLSPLPIEDARLKVRKNLKIVEVSFKKYFIEINTTVSLAILFLKFPSHIQFEVYCAEYIVRHITKL